MTRNALDFLSVTIGRLSDQTRSDAPVFLDRASVQGLTSLPPQDGTRGFGRHPIALRVLCLESIHRGRCGLAGPSSRLRSSRVERNSGGRLSSNQLWLLHSGRERAPGDGSSRNLGPAIVAPHLGFRLAFGCFHHPRCPTPDATVHARAKYWASKDTDAPTGGCRKTVP